MNEKASPNSNHKFPAPKVWMLAWKDLPGCAVLISRTIMSSDEAVVSVDHRKQLTLLLFRESLRGYVDVTVERGTVPDDQALLAMGRTIMAHLAAAPEWRDGP
jgi:hypothetical protein